MRYSAELKQLLFDTYNLYFKMQLYHWNIHGINFIELHKFFEEQYNNLAGAVDQLAEHMRFHKIRLDIDLMTIAEQSRIEPVSNEKNPIKLLDDTLNSNQILHKQLLRLIAKLTEPEEETTKDLIISRAHFHEKNIWILRSLTEKN